MYQHLQRHRVGLYEKALPNDFNWEEKLSATKELGFDFLEISVDESDERRRRLDWDDDTIYTLRRLCEQYQIPLQSMCLSAHRKFPFGSADPAIREQAVLHMEKAVTLAYKLVYAPFNWLVMTSITNQRIKQHINVLLKACVMRRNWRNELG